jgi:hypothetical protein
MENTIAEFVENVVRPHPLRTSIAVLGGYEALHWLIKDWLSTGLWMGLGYALVAVAVIVAVVKFDGWDHLSLENFNLVQIVPLPAVILHYVGAGIVMFASVHYRHMEDMEFQKARAELITVLMDVQTAGPSRQPVDAERLARVGMTACSVQSGADTMEVLFNGTPFIWAQALPFIPFGIRAVVGIQPIEPHDDCIEAYRQMRAAFPDYRTDLETTYPILNSLRR